MCKRLNVWFRSQKTHGEGDKVIELIDWKIEGAKLFPEQSKIVPKSQELAVIISPEDLIPSNHVSH